MLDRLATEKLAAEAENVAAEGWKWIEVAVDFRYGHANHLRRLNGVPVELTAEEQATFDALTAEYAKLESDYEGADELPDDVDARLGEIEAALAAFENRPLRYDPAEIARAGVFVSIDADGHARCRARLCPAGGRAAAIGNDDAVEAGPTALTEPASSCRSSAPSSPSAGSKPEEDGEDDAIKPLPERLVSELTAHRTLALRDARGEQPAGRADGAAAQALPRHLPAQRARRVPGGLGAACVLPRPGGRPEGQRLRQGGRRAARRPGRPSCPRTTTRSGTGSPRSTTTSRAALLAHCVSFGVNALYEKGDRYGGPGVSVHGVQQRLAQADRLARAVGLDMVAAGWRPTVDNYLGRVTKPRILEAVREAKGDHAAQLIDHLKKGEMAQEAERLLDGTGWLPEPLRLADGAPSSDPPAGAVETLPAFLTDGEDAQSQQAAE